ncbi:LysE/ArgO family amino acid transporter [Pseudomonas sp. OIL-1]|uniref:LysE/ArgO family amino acid transporter n=1 Tax=Pseudomonas sp. OIL-1 TaxID=2706126 RepID=UPI0013A7AEA5|nr:LysE/ArgO family amino acid transporter [Pseudomonas sp. OIL-1]QIB52750.1 amino acid transporter [Pseudomonas sp. OIL-1]
MFYLSNFINGLFTAAGLIMAIGAQNAFVLGQALRREHHLGAALVCMLCDALLITAGTFGLASLLDRHLLLLELTRWGGVLFLVCYALLALKRACSVQTLDAAEQAPRSRRAVVVATLAVTLLNPHVYIDTLVLIGSIGAQQSIPELFVLGAVSASVLWFSGLALGAARLAPVLSRPATWRFIDAGVAAMMLAVAWSLASSAP